MHKAPSPQQKKENCKNHKNVFTFVPPVISRCVFWYISILYTMFSTYMNLISMENLYKNREISFWECTSIHLNGIFMNFCMNVESTNSAVHCDSIQINNWISTMCSFYYHYLILTPLMPPLRNHLLLCIQEAWIILKGTASYHTFITKPAMWGYCHFVHYGDVCVTINCSAVIKHCVFGWFTVRNVLTCFDFNPTAVPKFKYNIHDLLIYMKKLLSALL